MYNFISDLCAVPTCTLPAAAHKILAQQLNTCHHETSSVHYAALVTVLMSCHQVSDRFADRAARFIRFSDVNGRVFQVCFYFLLIVMCPATLFYTIHKKGKSVV